MAGSFGDIFKRNSINNGLILVESPQLIEELTRRFAKDGQRGRGGHNGDLTILPTGWQVRVDTQRGVIIVQMDGEGERVFSSVKVGRSVQEIWVKGGLEGYIRASL